MKTIALTKGQFVQVDDEDFEYLSQFKWHLLTSSRSRTAYAARHRPGKHSELILLHRELAGQPELIVDHKDRDGLNCQKNNLRLASTFESAANVSIRKDNSSGVKGVSFRKDVNKWRAEIQAGGRRKRLGVFNTFKEAAEAYKSAAKVLHKEFAP